MVLCSVDEFIDDNEDDELLPNLYDELDDDMVDEEVEITAPLPVTVCGIWGGGIADGHGIPMTYRSLAGAGDGGGRQHII